MGRAFVPQVPRKAIALFYRGKFKDADAARIDKAFLPASQQGLIAIARIHQDDAAIEQGRAVLIYRVWIGHYQGSVCQDADPDRADQVGAFRKDRLLAGSGVDVENAAHPKISITGADIGHINVLPPDSQALGALEESAGGNHCLRAGPGIDLDDRAKDVGYEDGPVRSDRDGDRCPEKPAGTGHALSPGFGIDPQ